MFTATIEGDLQADLDAITRRLTAEQRTLGRTVARVARKALLANVRGKRGTLSFSGMGTKLGASTKVQPGAGACSIYLDAVPAGAWAITEHGRAVSVAKRAKALHIGKGDAFAMSADATTGQPGLWAGAEGSMADAIQPELESWADTAMGV